VPKVEYFLEKLNYTSPTPIQNAFFKVFNNQEKVLVGISKTGTGKTHAYLLPIMELITLKQATCLIIVPTNELVIQISAMVSQLQEILQKDKLESFKFLTVISGLDYEELKKRFSKNKWDLIVSTPSKIKYIIDNSINIKYLQYLVFDEADMMFDEDFLSLIDSILNYLQPKKQILVGATITKEMNSFISSFFGQSKIIDVSKETTLDIEYRLYRFGLSQREEKLLALTKNINPLLALIFVSKTSKAEWLYGYLKEHKINVCFYSSKLSISGRKSLFAEIIRGKYQYIISTDLTARGIDLEVSDVINYDFPANFEYVFHRFGRTGRMLKHGCVHIFASNDSSEQPQINKLKASGLNLVEYKIDGKISKIINKKAPNPELMKEIHKIPKPQKVTPNYKKKNNELIRKAKQQLIKKKAQAAFIKKRKTN
jgi:ATP-dependent RNA helicase CshB